MKRNGTPPFRIAIVGGGIGGLTAALFLKHACGDAISIDVFEQAGEFKEIGNGLGLGLNATRLFSKIDIGVDAFAEIAGRENKIWFTFSRYDTGEEITMVRSPSFKDGKQVSMVRSEFLDALLRYVKERNAATLHTGKKNVEIKVGSDLHCPPRKSPC